MVNVLAVGSGVGEALEAFWALEGLLAGVEPAVLGEVVLVLEGLVAVGALVRPLIWNTNSEMRLGHVFRRLRNQPVKSVTL